ncbi:hypothetical protein AMS68_003696 [Peltaster fructicola]|uniref:Uncharacterized protein n=1 Tax=Peltaster fructicola TaxID=286661 RepID=A0A6H0XU79_9PEZI|nr:hypothetical protein AMS68_003696 [Peltaster fructicola]
MSDDSGMTTPALSDRLSITALAISLIALVIGVSSFLQAILGTAEGYRRCASSVIGPWSKLRRRVFRWSEFRYETRFQAPLIKIVTRLEYNKLSNREHAGNIYLLNEKIDDDGEKPPKQRSWNPWHRYDPRDILRQSLHLTGSLSGEKQLEPSRAEDESVLLDDALGDTDPKLGRTMTRIERHQAKQSKRANARDTLLVSWIRLMHELHVVCGKYWPNEPCHEECNGSDYDKTFRSPLVATLRGERDFYGRQWESSARTRVAVIIMEWTWDFMPEDVTRPLAYSTIGHVVVLAMRLGMSWRNLDRTKLQLSADGNGRSITSTDVKNMGIVLAFSATGSFDFKGLDIIPSRAADKMMCGILPGDPDLVQRGDADSIQRDFSLVNLDRKLIQLWETDGVYRQIGLELPRSHTVESRDRCTHNEVVTLLSSFLPLPGSKLRGFLFSGWKRSQYSTFHFFEPRLQYLTTLRATQQRSVRMQAVLQILEHLSSDFKYAYYGGYVRDKTAQTSSPEHELSLTEFCAKQFRETTIYFKEHGYDIKPGNAPGTWYMQLVAAHAQLSAYVEKDTDHIKAFGRDQIPKDIRDLFEAEGIDSNYFSSALWTQVQLYVDGLDNAQYGVVQYMLFRGFVDKARERSEGDPQDIRDAWWTLILRGILWDMSCDGRPYPGEPVASSYFSDETRVWFT